MDAELLNPWAAFNNGQLWSVDFLRTRRQMIVYVARRAMGANEFREICRQHGYESQDEWIIYSARYPLIRALWKAVRKHHPGMRLRRVRVTL